MALAKIKKEYLTRRVGYNNSFRPLGKRSDIDDLAIIAIESNDHSLLRLFEKLPQLSLLKKNKTDLQLKKVVAANKQGQKK